MHPTVLSAPIQDHTEGCLGNHGIAQSKRRKSLERVPRLPAGTCLRLQSVLLMHRVDLGAEKLKRFVKRQEKGRERDLKAPPSFSICMSIHEEREDNFITLQ